MKRAFFLILLFPLMFPPWTMAGVEKGSLEITLFAGANLFGNFKGNEFLSLGVGQEKIYDYLYGGWIYGGIFTFGDYYNSLPRTYDLGSRVNWNFGVSLSYNTGKHFALEGEYEMAPVDYRDIKDFNRIGLSLLTHLMPKGRLVPYFSLGFGLLFTRMKEGDEPKTELERKLLADTEEVSAYYRGLGGEINDEVKVEGGGNTKGLFYSLGWGIKWFPDRKAGLRFDFRYFILPKLPSLVVERVFSAHYYDAKNGLDHHYDYHYILEEEKERRSNLRLYLGLSFIL